MSEPASQVNLTIDHLENSTETKFITDQLNQFNFQITGKDHFLPLNVVARDASGKIVGGLVGVTFWGWFHVDVLWVQANMRSHGLGGQILELAEQEALRRGINKIQLETHTFQALPFYLKHGYRIFGKLDDFPKGYTKYYLTKDLV